MSKLQKPSNLEWHVITGTRRKKYVRRTAKLNYYPLLVKQFWLNNFPKNHCKTEQSRMPPK
jgi:hypothetical protein